MVEVARAILRMLTIFPWESATGWYAEGSFLSDRARSDREVLMVSRKFPTPVPPSPVPPVLAADDGHLARTLLSKFHAHPGLNVCSLAVHRCRDGLCLEGRVVLVDPSVNLAALLAEFETTTPILNRVMVSAPKVDATETV